MSDLATSVSVLQLIAQLNASVSYAAALMIAIPAVFGAMSLAYLGSRFLDCAARQPEAEGTLFGRLLVIAALVDAAVILSLSLGIYVIVVNPFVSTLVKAIG